MKQESMLELQQMKFYNSTDDYYSPYIIPAWDLTAKLDIAHYKMNDNVENTTVDDSSGAFDMTWAHGNTSTDSTGGKINNALNFDGTNDYANIGASTWGVADTWSVCFWDKPDSVTGNKAIFTLQATGTTYNSFIRIYNTSAKLEIAIRKADGSNYLKDYVTTADVCSIGVWKHVAVTWNGTDLKLYINGTEITSFTKYTDVAGAMENYSRMLTKGLYKIFLQIMTDLLMM